MAPDYALLGVLARTPASGYDLGKWLEADGQFLGRKASMTPIYRSLAELADRGWVESEAVARGTGPDAKVHRLTPAGREALKEWAASPYTPSVRPMAPDFVVRLNFAGQLGPEYALAIVNTELEYRRRQRAAERAPSPTFTADPIPEIDPAWLSRLNFITHARGWQSTSLYIGWLETVQAELTAIVQPVAVATPAASTLPGAH